MREYIKIENTNKPAIGATTFSLKKDSKIPKIQFIIRVILTAILLCFVYIETGIWTWITLALACLAIEGIQWQLNIINKRLKEKE